MDLSLLSNFSWVFGALVIGYGLHRVGLLVPIVKSIFRINGYKKDIENISTDNGDKLILQAISEVDGKVERLIGNFETQVKSDASYHKAIVNNHKELVKEVGEIDKRVVKIEEQHRIKELRQKTI